VGENLVTKHTKKNKNTKVFEMHSFGFFTFPRDFVTVFSISSCLVDVNA